jgi:hypothetical protein
MIASERAPTRMRLTAQAFYGHECNRKSPAQDEQGERSPLMNPAQYWYEDKERRYPLMAGLKEG